VFAVFIMLPLTLAATSKKPPSPTTAATTAAPTAAPTTPTPTPLPITYHCDTKSPKFVYNLHSLKDKLSGFSYAIAPSTTHLSDILKMPKTNTSICIQNFTAFEETEKNVTGCTFDNNTIMLLYIDAAREGKPVIGGSSFKTYSLPCAIAKDVLVTVKKGFGATPAPPTKDTEIPDVLQLLLQDDKGNDETNFYVGQQINVIIHVTHALETHFLQVEECTAGDTETMQGLHFPLITSATTAVNEIIPPGETLESQATGLADVKFNMFAFRFAKTNDVFLQCKIKICMHHAECTKSTRRRRRSEHDKSLDVATAHFVVYDKDETSAGQALLGYPSLSAVIALVFLLYSWML